MTILQKAGQTVISCLGKMVTEKTRRMNGNAPDNSLLLDQPWGRLILKEHFGGSRKVAMKRALVLFFFAVIPPSQGKSQESEPVEPPGMRLEFIRRLRAKGYSDLALEQIDKLKGNPAVADVLPLERARTLLALARDKEPEQRQTLLSAAQAELDAFVRKNPSGPQGAQGHLEIARLAASLGQGLLTKALREEDVAIAKKAEKQFLEAGQQLEVAVKLLTDVVAKEKAEPTKQQLNQDLLAARFDWASNYIDQALTYINTASDVDNRKRAEAVDKAKQAFKQLASDSGPVGLLASAWLIKVNQEGQDPSEAEKHRSRVMRDTSKAAQPAQRLARLFYIQGILKNPNIKLDNLKKNKLIEDEAKKWLAAYPNHHKTQEGWAVRFELAQALYQEGLTLTKDPKAPPGSAALAVLNQAQKLFAAIGESDSNLAEKAKGFNVNISVMKLGDKTAVADLKDFDDCYLKAQVEWFKMRTAATALGGAAPKDRGKLEAERKQHLRQMLKALARGIMLADSKTSPHNLDEARYLLATGYLLAGDLYRAAVAGEALSRARPPTKRAAQAAGYAIEAYTGLLQEDNSDSNRQHFQNLAEYVLSPEMQKTWGGEPVTAVARYHLAMLYNKDNAYKEAIAQLDKLPPDYSGYIYAQGQLVFIAEEARDKAKTDEEKKAYTDVARKAILRMGKLPQDADSGTAAMYFFAQLELPKFYYADAAAALAKNDLPKAERFYNDMAKSIAGLKTGLEKTPAKLSNDTRGKLSFSMGVTAKYLRLGLAGLEYRKGNYDKVLAATEEIVAAVAKQASDARTPIRLKDYQVTGDVLGLALRANVQKGNLPKARQILGYLERLSGEDGGGVAETSNVLHSLIGDLQAQVTELKKANDSARLKATLKNFSAFIDDLATKDSKKDKGLELKDITFLAKCYASLEEHAKAANLYAQIPPPKALDKVKIEGDEEKEIATYWLMQINYAKELRLGAHSKEDLGKAKKVLDRLKGHKNARLQVYGDVEQIHILEDSDRFGLPLYGQAAKGWTGIMSNPTLKARMPDDPSLKDLYFNAYFGNAWCLYKYSQTRAVLAKGKDKDYLKAAANNILRLEKSVNQEGWQIVGHRFRELLTSEKKLRDEYETLKRTTK
jgi:hypothetical protein